MEKTLELEAQIKQNIASLSESAMMLKVVDVDTYAQAGELLTALKSKEKYIKGLFEDPKSKAHAAWKGICAWENEELNKLKPISQHLNKQMTDWYVVEERKRKAEEDRLRQEAIKREEEERLAAAIELEKEGYKEEAKVVISEPVYVPPPIIEKTQPKVAGLGIRTNWTWKVIDEKLIPREYLKIDDVTINGIVRVKKGNTKIPGIAVFEEKSMGGVRK